MFFAEFDRREILLITGLLFASMPALHYDARGGRWRCTPALCNCSASCFRRRYAAQQA